MDNLERALNLLPLATYVLQGGRLAVVSPKLAGILGYPAEELVGSPFSRLAHPGDREIIEESLKKALSGEKPTVNFGFRLIDSRGEAIRVIGCHAGLGFRGGPGVLGQVFEPEGDLRGGDEGYRELFENANDIIYTHDFEGNFTSLNTAALRTYGYKAGDIPGLNIRMVVDPGHIQLALENIEAKLSGAAERTGPYELLSRTREGDPVWVEVKTRLIFEGGRPAGVQGIARDITERKLYQERILESEKKLRNQVQYLNTLLDNINDVFLTYDTGARITYMTGRSRETLGYQPEELLGKSIFQIVHPEYRGKVLEGLRDRLERGARDNYEILSLNRDGSSRNIMLNTSPILEDGKIIGGMAIAEDVTANRQAQEQLRQSTSELRAIFEALPDIFLRLDRGGSVLDVSAGHASQFTIPPEQARGKKICQVLPPGAKDVCRQAVEQVVRTGALVVLEYSEQRKDGDQFFEIRILPLGDSQILAVVRNITDRKKSELALIRTEAKNRALINTIPDLMFVINQEGVFTDHKASRSGTLLVPAGELIAPGGLVGRTVYEVVPPDLAGLIMNYLEPALSSGETQSIEYEFCLDGKRTFQEGRLISCGESEVLVIVRDITDRKQMEEQLKYLSLHDPLTGLYNRAYFEQEMRRLEAGRHTSAGIIMSDVDGLKIVNDSLGHDAGDSLLKAAAGVISRSFRGGDMVARIGGDEFAVLLPDCDRAAVELALQRIRENIDRHNRDNPEFPLSISAGLAVSNGDPVSMGDLFKEADNNMYREKLHRSQSARSAIVQTLMKALEARDFITEGHAERLQSLVEALARAVGLPERSIADLRLLAKFHDIGKVGIPDRILFKKGPLTSRENAEMQRHCEIGHRIAKSATDLAPIADWILKHHEWCSGGGYPLGLKGDDIPLECRILAITDAYDAMTSNRPYRKGMSREEAVEEIKRCAGTQFDRDLVEKFVEVLKNFGS